MIAACGLSCCCPANIRRCPNSMLSLLSIITCLLGCGQEVPPRGLPPEAEQAIFLLRGLGFRIIASWSHAWKSPDEGIVVECRGESLDRLLSVISNLDLPFHLQIREGSINRPVAFPDNVLTCSLWSLQVEAGSSLVFGKNLQELSMDNCTLGEGVVLDVTASAGLFTIGVHNKSGLPSTVRWHPDAPLWWVFLEFPSPETMAAMPATKRLSRLSIQGYHGGPDHIHRLVTASEELGELMLADCDVHEQTIRELANKPYLSLVSFKRIDVPSEVYNVLKQTRVSTIFFDNVDVSKELILDLRREGRYVLVYPPID